MRELVRSIGLLVFVMMCCACGVVQPAMLPPTAAPAASPLPAATPTPTPLPATTRQPTLLAYIAGGDLWMRVADGPAQRLTSTGTASNPRWSPSGQWLAYCQDDQDWVMQRDGGAATVLGPCGGAWLPTSDRMAFRTADSTTIVDLTTGRRRAIGLAADGWSAAGTALVAVQRSEPITALPNEAPIRAVSIVRADADGAQMQEIVRLDPPARTDIIIAGWADGQVLFWTVPQFSASLLADGVPLNAILEDGGAVRELVPRMLAYRDFLDVSPDGTTLVVVVGEDRQTWTNKRLATVNLAHATRTMLTDASVAAVSPDWSPDGQQIAYVATPDAGPEAAANMRAAIANRRLWVMDRDGTHQRQLTNIAALHDEHPRWSADGRRIFFVRVDTNERASLWSVQADGRRLEQISATLGPRGNDEDTPEYYGYREWDRWFDVWQPRY